jgi:hypothetical protein
VAEKGADLPRAPSIAVVHIPPAQFMYGWSFGGGGVGLKREPVNCPAVETGLHAALRWVTSSTLFTYPTFVSPPSLSLSSSSIQVMLCWFTFTTGRHSNPRLLLRLLLRPAQLVDAFFFFSLGILMLIGNKVVLNF